MAEPVVRNENAYDLCEFWLERLRKSPLLGITAVDGLVAAEAGVSIKTVQRARKAYLDGMATEAELADIATWSRRRMVPYRHIPADHLDAFAAYIAAGLTPTAAYAALVQASGRLGVPVASQTSFLRHWKASQQVL